MNEGWVGGGKGSGRHPPVTQEAKPVRAPATMPARGKLSIRAREAVDAGDAVDARARENPASSVSLNGLEFEFVVAGDDARAQSTKGDGRFKTA